MNSRSVRDLLVVDEDVRVLELGRQLREVRREVGRQVALVELHALDDVAARSRRPVPSSIGDDAVVTDLSKASARQLADLGVVVGRDRGDAGLLGALVFTLREA